MIDRRRFKCSVFPLMSMFAILLTGYGLCSEPLRVLEPADDATVWLLRKDWREHAARCAAAEKDAAGLGKIAFQAFPETARFAWAGGVPPYRLTLTTAAGPEHDHQVALEISQTSAEVANLLVGAEYRWKLQDADGATLHGRFATAETPRLIALPDRRAAPVNVRDLGGWRTVDGGRVRQGMVYRGSELGVVDDIPAATDANRQFLLKELGIRTDLDLRYEEQVARHSCSGIAPEVQWLCYAINAYNPLTPEQNALFRETMRTFARPENYPIYVHCSGGADRTGEVCFLLNALLGVADEDLFADYELTSLARLPRPRTIPYFQGWLQRIAAFSPEGGLSFRQQAENYLLAIGVTPEEIAAIRQLLQELN